jgi:hypothetical protein
MGEGNVRGDDVVIVCTHNIWVWGRVAKRKGAHETREEC